MNRLRFAAVLAVGVLGLCGLVTAVGGALYASAGPADRETLARLVGEQLVLLVVLAVLVAIAAGLLLAAAVTRYVDLPRRLAADVALIAGANPGHRAAGTGPVQLRMLASAVNDLAQRYALARRDVDEQVAVAAAELERERNRLAALMGGLTVAVLVCGPDGRILLYNAAARELFAGVGTVGLGRSVFGVLDRRVIAHGLQRLATGLATYEAVTDVAGGLVRIRLTTVSVLGHANGPSVSMLEPASDPTGVPTSDASGAGFVLVSDDATRSGTAAALRAELLRSTGELLRGAAGSIGAAAGTMIDYPDMPAPQHRRFAEIVAQEAARLGDAARRVLADADLVEGRWPVAEMSARDLLAIVATAVARSGGPATTVLDEPGAECWLAVDSFGLTEALSALVLGLGAQHRIGEVELSAGAEGELARIDLRWSGAALPAGEPAVPPAGPAGAAEVVRRHGGELWADTNEPLVRLVLPLSGTDRAALDDGDPDGSPPGRPRPGSDRPAGERPIRERPPAALYDFGLPRAEASPSEWDDQPLRALSYTVFDTETTGFHPDQGDEIVSIGAVRIVGNRLLAAETFERLVDPGRRIPAASSAVHGITTEMVRGEPRLDEVLPAFAEFARDTVLVGHNVAFDMAFLDAAQRRTGVRLAAPVLDTLLVDGLVHPDHDGHTLEMMADRLGVSLVGRHTALGDALVTGEIFLRLFPLLDARGIRTLGRLRAAAGATAQARTSDRLYGRPEA